MRLAHLLPLALLLACNGRNGEDSGTTDTGIADTDPTDTGVSDTGDTGELPDLTVGDPDADLVVEACGNALPEPPTGELCAVSGDVATATHLLLQGRVLGLDRIYEDGEVLVALGDNGLIECAGCDCAEPTETLVVSCPDGAISPALVNAHDHIRYADLAPIAHGDERYDHRQDWRVGARGHRELRYSSTDTRENVLYGELRMLMGGATSIAGSISDVDAQGLLRNLDAAGYNEGLGDFEANYTTFPLGDIDGTMSASGCDDYWVDSTSALAYRVYLPHIAEGIDDEANNEYRCLSSDTGGGRDLVQRNTSIIHGMGVTPADIADISASGSKLVWSPRSNVSLYGFTAPVTTYASLGVPIALGTDWTPSGSAQMLRELTCADYLNEFHLGFHFTHRELWTMGTFNGALALGTHDQLGSLAPGLIADIAVFDASTRDGYDAVTKAQIGDVELVLRGSKALYGDADVIAGLRSDASTCDALGDCVADNVACLSEDTGLTLAQLQSAVGGSAYGLYQCGDTTEEPACLPFRDNEDGDGIRFPVSDLDDFDGDGVPDVDDLCPVVFDAGRPLDDFVQGDADSDGIGDACDACPLTAGETGCVSWGDVDEDGVPGFEDNCPDAANADQLDGDGDGIGDVCDACPSFAASSGACPELVYDVKDGTLPVGTPVVLEHMTVTATKVDRGVFAQLDVGQPGYVGSDHSGVWVYMGGRALPAIGDRITVEGSIDDFFGQIQLTDVVGYTTESTGNSLPAPVVGTTAELGTGGSRAAALEGALVTVEDVSVTAVDLAPGPGDTGPTNEFEVDSALVIDDYLYLIEPAPVVGEPFASLTGPLAFRHDKSVILPRSAADVVAGPASLAAFAPDAVIAEASGSVALELSLVRPAAALETATLDCQPAAQLSCPASVQFQVGEQTATVNVTTVDASDTPATVTAALNGSEATASVRVYDDSSTRSVVALDPSALTLFPDDTATLVLTLDLPAPSSGPTTVPLSSGGFVSHPATVDVPAGFASVAFDITAPSTTGSDTLTATLNGSASSDITVSEGFTGTGQLFSQYLEGSSGTKKMVEIVHADVGDLDRSTCQVNLYSNGNTTAGSQISLDAGTMSTGEVWVLCNVDDAALEAVCDQTTGALSFNGDDAVELVCGGVVQDIIGQIGIDPGSSWGPPSTANGTLIRDCGVRIGDRDGSDAFDPSVQWAAGTADSPDGFGAHCL